MTDQTWQKVPYKIIDKWGYEVHSGSLESLKGTDSEVLKQEAMAEYEAYVREGYDANDAYKADSVIESAGHAELGPIMSPHVDMPQAEAPSQDSPSPEL